MTCVIPTIKEGGAEEKFKKAKKSGKQLPLVLTDSKELPQPVHSWSQSGSAGPPDMHEYHVDAAESFMDWRLAHPLRGNFSVRWYGRPSSMPSVPPPLAEQMEAGDEIDLSSSGAAANPAAASPNARIFNACISCVFYI